MNQFTLQKDPSGYYLKWRVVDADGRMVWRASTKRQAAGYAAILNGDLSGARDFYRDLVRDGRRRLTLKQAWAYAASTVAEMGVGPSIVGADPNTGEPTP